MKRRILSTFLAICLLAGLLPTAVLAVEAPTGYTTDSNGIMAYKEKSSSVGSYFDIRGYYGTNWLETTYSSSGYLIQYDGLSNASVAAKAEFTNAGRYIKVTHTVTAGDTAISGGKLAIHADIQIGLNDTAAVSVIQNASGKVIGLKMINDTGTYGKGAQFNLYFDGTGGVTPVNTYWFGYQQKRGSHLYDQLNDSTVSADGMTSNYTKSGGVYTGFSGKDSAATFSWNVNLTANESKTFSFLVGVGAKADPPALAADAPISLTANIAAADNGRIVDVSASVTDADGLTDTLYYSVDGGTEQTVGSVTADGTAKDITGSISLSGLADGAHTLAFWVVNSSGALSPNVTREVTVSASGVEGLDAPPHSHTWDTTAWDHNSTHHWHNCTADGCPVSDPGDKDAYAAHTPGDAATCTEPQKCTVCQTVLEAVTPHTPGDPATCTEPQKCTVCQTVLEAVKPHTPGPAATCTTPQTCTVCGATITAATGHDFTGDYLKDADGHWHKCKNCDATDTKAAHTWDGAADAECNVCGYTRALAPVITTATLPDGERGSRYYQALAATGDTPFTWSVTQGALPGGLTLESGVIHGTPTAAGTFTFTVTATNAVGTDTKELSITVKVPFAITTASLPGGTVGTAYSAQMECEGAPDPNDVRWSIATEFGDHPLPGGLTISDTGIISGTPTTAGNFSFYPKVTSGDKSATMQFIITVSEPTSTHSHAMSTDCSTSEGAQVAFTALTSTGGELATGNYYLTGNVDLTDTLALAREATVNLCLNGYALKGATGKRVITVELGGKLNLCDCNSGTTHKFSVDSDTGLWTLDEENGTNPVTGGVITGGKAGNGGGVYVVDNGSNFTMHGGTIVGNTADQSGSGGGGGVYIGEGNAFTMNGGTISGNAAQGSCNGGAGVYVDIFGTFTMNGGSISGNTAQSNCDGGGVYVSGGTFNMADGTISGNKGSQGGGVYQYSGTISMSGGSVTSNTASASGGVYVRTGTLSVSGSPNITGNKKGEAANNVYLSNGNKITIASALTEGASIGVTTATKPDELTSVAVAGPNDDDYSAFFFSDDTTYVIGNSSNNYVQLTVKPSHTHTMQTDNTWTYDGTNHWHQCTDSGCTDLDGSKTDVTQHTKAWVNTDPAQHWQTCATCGWAGEKTGHDYDTPQDTTCNTCGYERAVTPPHSHAMSTDCSTSEGTQVEFIPLPSTGGELAAGNYYLTENVDLTETLVITDNATVNLCLNGYALKYIGADKASVITVEMGGKLNLCDCNGSKSTHNFTVDSTTGLWTLDEASGTQPIPGGVITGGRSGSTNGGGGVCVLGGACFTMSGGSLTGNNAGYYGGGVYVAGTFNMTGGSITGNKSTNYGGGVYAAGTFNMTGGKIADNTAGNNGGGVYVDSSRTFNMSSGSITGNKTTYGNGGGVYINSNNSTFTVSGNPKITGNTKDSTVNNVHLNDRKTITIDGSLTDGASIGVTTDTNPTKENPVPITGANSADCAQYFTSDKDAYTVQNSGADSAQVIQLAAKAATPTITTTTLPAGERGSRYSQTLAATGTTPITWSVTQGSLPDGLTLNATTGLISGTPTTAGTSTFTVGAINTAGTGTKELSITVKLPFSITTASLPSAVVGTAYSAQMECEGAPDPDNVIWSIATEFGTHPLPDGLTISANGLISGTPTTTGSFSFYPKASSGGTSSSGKQYTIIVSEEAPAHTHTMQTGNNWTSDGTNHWHQCTDSDCPDLDGSKTDVTAHTTTWDADGTQHWQTCSVCGWVGTKENHNWSDKWSADDSHHWYDCQTVKCPLYTTNDTHNNLKKDYGEHVYDNDQDRTCNACPWERNVTPPTPVTPHTCTGMGTSVTFDKTLTTSTLAPASGNYYLAADLDIGENTITIGDGVSVKLCLNGHKLTYTQNRGNAIEVSVGGTLELCDCGANGQIFSNGDSAIFVEGGTLTVHGGKVESTAGFGISTSYYSDADSEDDEDFDAMVAPTVTVNGGEIIGNVNGINLMGGKLTVNGGNIDGDGRNGEDSYRIAGIYGMPDELTITGGNISGKGYGLYLLPNGDSVTLSGGTFSGTDYWAIYLIDGIQIGDTSTTYADLLAPGYVYQTVSGGVTVPADNKTAIEAEKQLKVVCGGSQPTPVHTHAWATAWETSDTHHWHNCTATGCTVTNNADKDGYGAHTEDTGTVTTQPTKADKGVKTYKCTVCQKVLRTEEIPALGFGISGTVTDGENTAVSGVTVTLKQGNTTIATTTTDSEGKYSFTAAAPGSYNVVATKDGKTMTILVVITDTHQTEQNLTMPSDNVNSVLEVKGDNTPAVVVGGLEKEAEANKEENSTVTVTMTVEAKAEAAAPNAGEIKAAAGQGVKLDYLEIKMEKTVEADGTATTDTISTTSDLLTIIIPFDFTGKNKASVTVYRYHGNSVDTLTATANSDGEKIELGTDSITLKVKNFSTYAIGYTETTSEPEPTPTPRPSSSGSTYYTLAATAGEGGTIAPSGKVSVRSRTNKTFTITPAEGYTIADVLVDDKSVGAVSSYTFEKVTQAHTIMASFKEAKANSICAKDSTCPIAAFGDAKVTAWYHDGVHYCLENGLMIGTSDTTFAPDMDTSRGMIVTILWRQAGSPAPAKAGTFDDVSAGAWYAQAVTWAAENGVVEGYGNGKFGPDDTITREQLAAMLWRYAGKPVTEGSMDSFNDSTKTSTWAVDALCWAVEQGIITGKTGGVLDPTGTATRAEAAAMLQRFCESKK